MNVRHVIVYACAAALAALLAGTCVLYARYRSGDEWITRLLQTVTGDRAAPSPQPDARAGHPIEPFKTPEQMNRAELAAKQQLETEISSDLPTNQVELTNGQILTGRIVDEKPDRISFRQGYRDSAEVVMQITRSRIRAIRPYVVRVPAVTYRDIRFKMEEPDFHFYKMQPYSFMTDESYFSVMHAVNELQRLYRDFRNTFDPLINKGPSHDDIQVLFFSDEKKYHDYQDATGNQHEFAVGFYTPKADRLVVFNQVRGTSAQSARQSLDSREAAYRSDPRYAGRDVTEWRKKAEQQVAGFAQAETLATIRHEGSHQLFHTLGIQQQDGSESDWVVEGSACYCQTPRLGDLDPDRAPLVRAALRSGVLLPLRRLLGIRSGSFRELQNRDQMNVAYAQAWSVWLFLMRRENSGRFFEYLKFIEDPSHRDEVSREDDIDLLARFEGWNAEQFEKRWKEFVATLPE